MLGAVFMVIIFLFVLFSCVKSMQNSAAAQPPRSWSYTEISSIHKTTDKFVQYDYSSKTLIVNKRLSLLEKLLIRKPVSLTTFGHTPEKLVYTSATVGGVTTGGFHKTGGDYAYSRNSGRCKLFYLVATNNKVSECEVHRIVLSNELANEAKTSKIKDYLNGNTIVVMQEVSSAAFSAAREAMHSGHKHAAMNLVSDAEAVAAPSVKMVRDIARWLAAKG